MASKETVTVSVKFDGSDSIDGKDLKWGHRVMRVQVDQRMDSPASFSIDLQTMKTGKQQSKDFQIIDKIKVGAEVEIGIGYEDSAPLLVGEVSYVEPGFADGDMRVSVGGYDYSHRLTRGTSSRTFGDGHQATKKPGDVAGDVVKKSGGRKSAGSNALSASTGGGSAKVSYVSQVESNDFEFLQSLGGAGQTRAGGTADNPKEVGFKPVDGSGSAVLVICRDKREGTDPKYRYPLSVDFNMSSVKQVSAVEVRGWSSKDKKAFVGRCDKLEVKVPSNGTPGHEVASKGHYGSASAGPVLTIVDRPVQDKAEAEELAKSIFQALSWEYMQAEIVVEGTPKVGAGSLVELDGFTKRFDGDWLVKAATHVYTGADSDGQPYTVRLSLMRNAEPS